MVKRAASTAAEKRPAAELQGLPSGDGSGGGTALQNGALAWPCGWSRRRCPVGTGMAIWLVQEAAARLAQAWSVGDIPRSGTLGEPAWRAQET
jgi:hypothetical protein